MEKDVVIVGGGLSGLRCALECEQSGLSVCVLEKENSTGGRIQTNRIQGFLLDRGFQVLLSSYSEIRSLGILPDLKMNWFPSGARIALDAGTRDVYNPILHPGKAFRKIPLSGADFQAFFQLGAELSAKPESALLGSQRESVGAYLSKLGFSDFWKEAFFRPFFGGVLLDPDLETDAGYFLWLVRQFARGKAGLPESGMAALPETLEKKLSRTLLVKGTTFRETGQNEIQTQEGLSLRYRFRVEARGISTESGPTATRGTSTLYFEGPFRADLPNMLILNGSSEKRFLHFCFPSQLQPSYAPSGKSLCSLTWATCLQEEQVETAVETVFRWMETHFPQWNWKEWRFLHHDSIPLALPVYQPGKNQSFEQQGNRFFIGDRYTYPSLNGALKSGREAGEAISRLARMGS